MRTLAVCLCAFAVCLTTAANAQLELPFSTSPIEQKYVRDQEFTSPLTGKKFTAQVLSRPVGFGVRDFDGCPHPPLNALAYALVIDPATGYVAYPEEFSKRVKWTTTELATIVGKPRFPHGGTADAPWDGAFGWEKFENAAKLAQSAKSPAPVIANWWLQAAWSVRLDLIPAQADFADDLDRAAHGLPPLRRDPADLDTPYLLQLANSWARHLNGEDQGTGTTPPTAHGKQPPPVSVGDKSEKRSAGPPSIRSDQSFIADTDTGDGAIAVAWAYRACGELVAARQWLGRAKADPGMASAPIYKYLDSSITLERDYLTHAQHWLRQAYEGGDIRESQRGAAAFDLGEIARRLGQDSEAAQWYAEADGKPLGSVSPRVLERQKRIVVTKSVYP